jgi:hypothetical protein
MTALSHLAGHRTRLSVGGQLELARLHRRQGQWASAVSIWESLAASGCAEAMGCLAKYHEHVAKDPVAALAFAVQLADLRPGAEAQKRILRLENKRRGRAPVR